MYTCKYTYEYIYIYIYTFIYLFTICVHMYIYIYIYTHTHFWYICTYMWALFNIIVPEVDLKCGSSCVTPLVEERNITTTEFHVLTSRLQISEVLLARATCVGCGRLAQG